MRKLKEEFREIETAERGLLARLIAHADERTTVTAILDAEEFEKPVHRRVYSALMLVPGGELEPMGMGLHSLMLSRADEEAAELLVELSCQGQTNLLSTPYPASVSELVMLAVYLHDQSGFRENKRLAEEAFDRWVDEELERTDIPVGPDPDDLEW